MEFAHHTLTSSYLPPSPFSDLAGAVASLTAGVEEGAGASLHNPASDRRMLEYFKGCQMLIVSYRLPVRLFMCQTAGPTGAVTVRAALPLVVGCSAA